MLVSVIFPLGVLAIVLLIMPAVLFMPMSVSGAGYILPVVSVSLAQ
jgi:hypothetical protein